MKFIDLFAGLGGFHIGLKKINAECVFACEIDEDLRDLYKENFGVDCQGDITEIHAESIPSHDVLCAGFPCQPFSKAGHQKGLTDLERGKMIYEIARILSYHHPEYFILENVPNFKTHNTGETWKETYDLLKNCNYSIQDFILSPHHFGIPHKRERIFIIGTKNQNMPLRFNKKVNKNNQKHISHLLEPNKKTDKQLSTNQLKCLETWQKFISSLPKNKPLPKFPIWAMEFGATYPLNGKCPYYMSAQELAKYKGAFGQSLKNLTKKEQLQKFPKYATYNQAEFPKWKINYIQKNRDFWKANKNLIQSLIPEMRTYMNSWQKLEWNAGDGKRNIFEYILQFRSSGIRVKSLDFAPSLVLTGTQTPIVAWQKRYLNLKEAQKLQGFENITMPNVESHSFRALGNAVNTKVVSEIMKEIIKQKNSIHVAKKQTLMIPAAISA